MASPLTFSQVLDTFTTPGVGASFVFVTSNDVSVVFSTLPAVYPSADHGEPSCFTSFTEYSASDCLDWILNFVLLSTIFCGVPISVPPR
ncbi:Uncharacterised protein [Chlamydia trachomatis]|nr:Uncharacterised protein [Chlamydia trachomatis]